MFAFTFTKFTTVLLSFAAVLLLDPLCATTFLLLFATFYCFVKYFLLLIATFRESSGKFGELREASGKSEKAREGGNKLKEPPIEPSVNTYWGLGTF